ncbi:MAG: hypothetical protein CMG13_03960 [Candidatus Marinimicrobia bacterium]|nr:hypothetical protein [Candidatus Neomarinimicrobiota bacterium]|tara:strand:+ start:16706 stop:17830 length:1125 start_codon:yes stop_codon:yes gene_type:complete
MSIKSNIEQLKSKIGNLSKSDSKKSSMAIDIGHFRSKLVELSIANNNISVIKIGANQSFNNLKTFDPDNATKAEWVANAQDILTNLKIRPRGQKNLISSIIGSSTTIKQIVTLDLGGSELIQSLEFEAKKHIPLDGTEVIMDYHIVGDNIKEAGKIDVLLVATTKNLINQHNQLISEIGFKNSGIFDATPIALANLHTFNKGMPEQGTDVIINIGNKTTTIVAYGKNQEFFTRELNISGHHFNKEIMRKNEIDYSEAENIKIEKGVSVLESKETPEESGFSIQVSEKTVFTNFVEELRKSLRYYMKSSPDAFFNKIYLTGGSANLLGLKDFISTNLNSDVELLDPFEKITLNESLDNPYEYSVVVGCALRGIKK